MLHLPMHIVKHKKLLVTVFLITAIICFICMLQVSVNYNLVDYLPKDSPSTVALNIMDKEFSQNVPNARVMLSEVTITKALEYKEKIEAIEGVNAVIWLDDVINLKEPIEMANQNIVAQYYKDNTALLSVSIEEEYDVSATDSIYQLIGNDNAMAGDIVNVATSKGLTFSETTKAFVILIPIILIILLVSTQSWIEPLLFLGTIGISVLLNMGSNIFLGEVSFMTQAISPILQMAVSLDYAIFLLHSFADYRKQTNDINEAMQLAMKRAFPAILASAATTLFGFFALIFMRFGIGSDLGINLMKGIIFSFISVMVFLPALTLCCYKLIDCTKHKHILPNFTKSGTIILKFKIPFLILISIIIIPGYLAQSKNTYIYGTGSISPDSRGGMDEIKISEKFGKSTAIVLLVPKGHPAKEKLLCDELAKSDHVKQVISYSKVVGLTIPAEYLDSSVTEQFYSEHYVRIILYTDTSEEGDEAFTVVEQIQKKAESYYGNTVYSCGQSANLNDMKKVISADTTKVNAIAIAAIAIVLFLTFQSLISPLILLFTIETAIWINLAVPYFSGNSICYIGYLVISTVQLGATVDYAILFTDHYRVLRKDKPKREAILLTYGETFHSILVSAVILASAGFVIAYTSTNPIVSQLGMLLGRGTILSMAMVVCILPALLLTFDSFIKKTTLHSNYFKEVKNE